MEQHRQLERQTAREPAERERRADERRFEAEVRGRRRKLLPSARSARAVRESSGNCEPVAARESCEAGGALLCAWRAVLHPTDVHRIVPLR